MTTGELWVVPWLLIILSWWILCATVIMVRNWVRLRRLEQHNKFLQYMVVEGVGNLAKRVTAIDRIPFLKPIPSETECPSELRSGEAGIRITEEPAAIEETEENGDNVATRECEDQTRAGVRGT